MKKFARREPDGEAGQDVADEKGAPESPPSSPVRRMLKKFGIAGFIFFFLKGLILWVLIPLGLLKWFGGCG